MLRKPGNTTSQPNATNAEICYKYNFGRYNYKNRKYRHACLFCKHYFHPKSVCHMRKAEAKSARGDKLEKDLLDTPPRMKHLK